MEGVQQLWGVTNPGSTENMVADLLVISLALKNPAHAARLDLIAKLVNASDIDGMAQPLKLLATTETDSPEFDLVKFILGDGTDMPAWEDIAAKVVTLAIADGQTVAPAPKPTPPPTAPTAQPAPDADDDPATLLARLSNTGGQATTTVTPPAADDANGTTATAQPKRRQRRRATRGAGQPTAQS